DTKEYVPVTAFLHADQLAKDIARINDAARGRLLSVAGVTLALLRNYNPFKSPTHFRLTDLIAKFDKCFGMSKRAQTGGYGKVTGDRTIQDIEKRRGDRWNFLFIAGMWFQDLFNYDFRRTEQCIIPYATQEGEISFCAYNTGVGWRNIIEKMHMTATLTKWYEEHGRHEIFAGGKKVGMGFVGHELKLNMEHVNSEANHTLDNLGIAKNAREEKIRARDLKKEAEDAKMAKLYREHVLGEKPPADGIVSVDMIRPASNNAASPVNRNRESDLVAGD
ncbi:MAG TPA: radical SAM protein, partial [Terracidiphilus sp.]